MATEKTIEREILHRLNMEKGVWAIKYENRAQFDPERGVRLKQMKFIATGMSDIICLVKFMGLLFPVFMEVKTAKGKQSDIQKAVQKKLTNMCGYYKVVRSVGDALHFLDEVKTKLAERLERNEELD